MTEVWIGPDYSLHSSHHRLKPEGFKLREIIVVAGDEHRAGQGKYHFLQLQTPGISDVQQRRTTKMTTHVLPDCWLSLIGYLERNTNGDITLSFS